MSQVQPSAIQQEFRDVLTVVPVHGALVYLVKKHGPTEFPEQVDLVLSYLGMLNPNIPWENYPLFAKMIGICVQGNEALNTWFSENNIVKAIGDHHHRVNTLQAEVNGILFPAPMQPMNAELKLA